ncbi:cadmium resistance transporter [Luedemannella helvata]|uniref:Cadmium resistance transporter n=1 Tax=Luedemannella helvata TaxID=349315 RepID=A0ABN2K959_9ACTN
MVATAAGVFAGTNVDDLVVLTVLFLSARATGRPRPWHIWAGQYAGIAVLVAASALAALGLAVVPDGWVRFLGLIPLALGVKGFVTADGSGEPVPGVTGWVSVAGITIANGADNIAVYTPLLRTVGAADGLVITAVFAVGVALWCLAGSWLGAHPRVIAVVERFGRWLVPGVFVALGLLILFGL